MWGCGERTPEEKKKNKNHPSTMVSRSKVSGMVNFLSTVNIGKLSGKDSSIISSDTKYFFNALHF